MVYSLSEIVPVSKQLSLVLIYELTHLSILATNYAPTAQAASQQGKYLARVFAQLSKKENLSKELALAKASGADAARLDSLANGLIRASEIRPFHYSVSFSYLFRS